MSRRSDESKEMELPKQFAGLFEPLLSELPITEAMPLLLPAHPSWEAAIAAVAAIVADPVMKSRPELVAGLWLYVDRLNDSHTISQGIPGPVGCLWHGIMHRREGDFSNSKYWFRQAGAHQALAGMDPIAFVDKVEKQHKDNPDELVEYQRREWSALFEWCAREAVR